MRAIKYVFGLMLLLALLISAGFAFVVTTATGTNMVLDLVRSRVPGFVYGSSSGRLLGPLSLDELRYQADDLTLEADQVQFNWEPKALFGRLLRLNELNVQGVTLHLPATADETPDTEPLILPTVQLPLDVDIQRLRLSDVRIYPPASDQPVVIDHIELQARSVNGVLELTQFAAVLPKAQLKLNGQLTPVGDYPVNLAVSWQLQHESLGELHGQGELSGTVAGTLSVHHELQGIIEAQLQADVKNVLNDPYWQAAVDVNLMDVGVFTPDLADTELTAQLQSQGRVQDFMLNGDMQTVLPQIGSVTAQLALAGRPEILQINALTVQAAEHPMVVDVHGEVNLSSQQVTARGAWRALSWPLNGPAQVQSPEGEFAVDGSLQSYRLSLTTRVQGPDLGQLETHLSAQGSTQRLQLEQWVVNVADGPATLTAQGEIDFNTQAFSASGEWQALAWPLSGVPQVESPSGQFSIDGHLDDYRLLLETLIQGPSIPKGVWRFQGQGSQKALQDFRLQSDILNGELALTGQLAWQPRIAWQATLNGSGLNPGVQWSQLPGDITFDISSTGTADAAIDIGLDSLSGTLSGQALTGQAKVQLNGQDIRIESLELQAGEAQLSAAGELAEQWRLDWQLRIPDLARLLPQSRGVLNSTGQLRGSLQQPQAEIELQAQQLAYATVKLQNLRGGIQLDASGQRASQLSLTGEGLQLAEQSWQALDIKGNGTPEQHQLSARLRGSLGSFGLGLQGRWQAPLWQGQLTRLDAQQTLAGNWQLDQPVALALGQQQARLATACISSRSDRVCLEGQWDGTQGMQAQLNLQGLNLNRFQTLLPQTIAAITNTVSGAAAVTRSADGQIQGQLDFKLTPGQLKIKHEGRAIAFDIKSAIASASSDGQQAKAQLNVDLGRLGRIAGDATINDITTQGRIAGKVQAVLTDFSPVSSFVPQLQNVTGQLVAQLNLAGALPVPSLQGQIALTDAATDIPELGTRIEAIRLQASGDGQGPLKITGSARSGPGQLTLSGQLELLQRRFDIAIQGERFQALNALNLNALISPDLKLTMADQQIRLTGRLTVPQARLSPPDAISGGVARSSDVIIVQRNQPSEAQTTSQQLFSNLRLILGDDVKVSVASLDAQLSGSLLIEQSPQLAPRGTGSIEVVAGDYVIYGQSLAIERGRVLYSGSPLDNPGLDLKVSRRFDDVTAGATVRGTLRQPRLTLFSSPSMPDSSILSYLAFGRAPGENSTSDNAALYQAAAALGANGGVMITDKLSAALGLDTLSFDSGSNLDEASLVVGKYLSPDFYISYGIGLFEAVNTFNMRYRITERLSVESAIGTHNSADVLYSVESDE